MPIPMEDSGLRLINQLSSLSRKYTSVSVKSNILSSKMTRAVLSPSLDLIVRGVVQGALVTAYQVTSWAVEAGTAAAADPPPVVPVAYPNAVPTALAPRTQRSAAMSELKIAAMNPKVEPSLYEEKHL